MALKDETDESATERLGLQLEEMGEALQIIGKIFRHGWESTNPLKKDKITNRMLLEKELGDVKAAMVLLIVAGDVNKRKINTAALEKLRHVARWLHHQPDSLLRAATMQIESELH